MSHNKRILGVRAIPIITLALSCFLGIFFLSCDGAGASGEATGSLSLQIGGSSGRTLTPSVDMSVSTYTLTLTGPGGETVSVPDFTETTYSRDDLAVGEWAVAVDAYNAAGTAVGRGEATVTIASGANAEVTVYVGPVDGTGSLTLSLSWPSGSIDDPVVSADLTKTDGTETAFTLTSSGAAASGSLTDAATGYYTLILSLSDGDAKRWSKVESVRIINGAETSASYDLTEDDLRIETTADPEFSVAAGTYDSAQTVTISCATTGASIYYNRNGAVPDERFGTLYEGPITVSSTLTIKAAAFKDKFNDSSVVEAA